MQGSRLSRVAARVANALMPSKQDATKRSIQKYAYNANGSNDQEQKGDDFNDDHTVRSSKTDIDALPDTRTLGKRKRRSEELAATTVKPDSEESSAVRRSPRKAIKLEEGSAPRKAKRQPAKRIKGENGVVTVQPPANWEEVYNITAEMRKRVLAPVDTMGCESLAEDHRSPRDRRLQTLVALMLSSQTKDTVTAVAMKNLQDNLAGGFCLESLLAVEPVRLNELISKVGFHNNKTKFIKSVAVILRDQYDGDIPDTIDGLVSLPGVGPKMAYLCMSAAWGRDEGIGVDVHVHRITNLWGWHKTNTPEQTRAELEAWLPKEKWHDINHLLVGFGQTICAPVGRKCSECDLSARKLCPSAVPTKSAKKTVKKVKGIEIEAGQVLGEENVSIEADDSATTVRIKSEAAGEVEIQALAGTGAVGLDDIEGLGAGEIRKYGAVGN